MWIITSLFVIASYILIVISSHIAILAGYIAIDVITCIHP